MEKDILQYTEHREYPLPTGKWIMMQKWENLLFLHWPVPPDVLKEFIPDGIELDIYKQKAWITLASFEVSKLQFRHLPTIPHFRSPLQLNIRTCVKRNGRKGVYFLHIDVNKLYIVLGGKITTLPFSFSNMAMIKIQNQYTFSTFHSNRHSFQVTYEPKEQPVLATQDELNKWLLERYVLWTSLNNSLYQGDIHHQAWEVQQADIQIRHRARMPYIPEEEITEPALAHFVDSKVAYIWMLKRVGGK